MDSTLMSDQENNPSHFIKYGNSGQDVNITIDMIMDDIKKARGILSRNPFDFLSKFELWFGWERSVHLDGHDPIELNIGVDRFRMARDFRRASLEKFMDGCCARLVIQGSGGLK